MNAIFTAPTEKEIKTRKHWLWALFCSLVYPIFLVILITIVLQKAPTVTDSPRKAFLFVTLGIFIGWIYWHCVYKKAGRKLLTCFLVTSPFHPISSLPEELFQAQLVRLALLVSLPGIALFIWWYILSFKLWKINPKFRVQIFGGPEYIASVEAFKTVTSRDDLDRQYSDAKIKWPKLKTITSKEYKRKKVEFFEK
jgi:hypothetical protein